MIPGYHIVYIINNSIVTYLCYFTLWQNQKVVAKKLQPFDFGGEGGIRTHVTLSRQLDFESSSL